MYVSCFSLRFSVRAKQLPASIRPAALLCAHALQAVRRGSRQGPLNPPGVPGRGGGGPRDRGQMERHGEECVVCGQRRGAPRGVHRFVAVPVRVGDLACRSVVSCRLDSRQIGASRIIWLICYLFFFLHTNLAKTQTLPTIKVSR